jgi:hypothetical protein
MLSIYGRLPGKKRPRKPRARWLVALPGLLVSAFLVAQASPASATSVPPMPTNVTATTASPTSITVRWQYSGAPGAVFYVYQAATNDNITSGPSAANATSMTFSNLAAGESACYSVIAYALGAFSAWTDGTACAATKGWVQPRDWFAHVAGSGDQGDPINVIISGNSTIGIYTIISGLENLPAETFYAPLFVPPILPNQHWQTVLASPTPDLFTHCITQLVASVDPAAPPDKPEDISARQGGCETVLANDVDHIRLWYQSESGAYFITASKEHPCLHITFNLPTKWVNHCVTDYDGGRGKLVGDILTLASQNGWRVNLQLITPSVGGQRTQFDGTTLSFDGLVLVVTIG